MKLAKDFLFSALFVKSLSMISIYFKLVQSVSFQIFSIHLTSAGFSPTILFETSNNATIKRARVSEMLKRALRLL